MNFKVIALATAGVILLAGCAGPQTRWAWSDYRENLYSYYDNKMSQEQLLESFLKVEKESAERGTKVAPGVYADIGTMYVRLGKPKEAISYYEKEASTWPESAPFMKTLIEGLKRNYNLQQGA